MFLRIHYTLTLYYNHFGKIYSAFDINFKSFTYLSIIYNNFLVFINRTGFCTLQILFCSLCDGFVTGRVYSGMSVVKRIGLVETDKNDRPVDDVKIVRSYMKHN